MRVRLEDASDVTATPESPGSSCASTRREPSTSFAASRSSEGRMRNHVCRRPSESPTSSVVLPIMKPIDEIDASSPSSRLNRSATFGSPRSRVSSLSARPLFQTRIAESARPSSRQCCGNRPPAISAGSSIAPPATRIVSFRVIRLRMIVTALTWKTRSASTAARIGPLGSIERSTAWIDASEIRTGSESLETNRCVRNDPVGVRCTTPSPRVLASPTLRMRNSGSICDGSTNSGSKPIDP